MIPSQFGSRLILSTLALAVTLAFAGTATAQTLSKCGAGKKKCVSKKMACLLKGHSKAEKLGLPPDPVALQKCQDKFDGGVDPTKGCFEKLEVKNDNCLTFDDTAALESKVDAFVLDVVTDLDPGYPAVVLNKCSAGKKKCVSKKAKCLLNVHAKAEKKGLPPDPVKLQKCQDKFDGGADPSKGCFAKLEANSPPCLTTSDTAALEAKVDAFVTDVVCEIDPAAAGCAGSPCATSFTFTATGANSDFDVGWTGITHDDEAVTNSRFTLALSNCDSPTIPCGECDTAGPIDNPGGATFANHRCRGDNLGDNGSWITCTTNADCTGTDNACVFFFGAPRPISAGGVGVCLTNEMELPVSGTVNVEAGSSATSMTMRWMLYSGPTVEDPCPRCVSGTCSGGQRHGFACTTQGTTTTYGDNSSLDCPPLDGVNIGVVRMPLTLATGMQTKTLSAGSPNCTAAGFTGSECMCSTCNNGAAEPCDDDGDCLDPAGPIGPICGGRRCLSGSNNGAACTVNSECPSGICNVPGNPTRPNDCGDGVCSPNGADTDSVDEGVCNAGPSDQYCNIATYRGCLNDSDCNAFIPGDTCNLAGALRQCFTANGAPGDDVSVAGVASPTAPTLGALFCMPPSAAGAANSVLGLPGLGRLTIPGTSTFN